MSTFTADQFRTVTARRVALARGNTTTTTTTINSTTTTCEPVNLASLTRSNSTAQWTTSHASFVRSNAPGAVPAAASHRRLD
jgi:hypothetical protein